MLYNPLSISLFERVERTKIAENKLMSLIKTHGCRLMLDPTDASILFKFTPAPEDFYTFKLQQQVFHR
jgi:hypothetical protein